MMDIKREIISAIKQSLAELTSLEINFLVEKPEDESFGDYSSNIALVAAKILKKNPFDLAQTIVKMLYTKYLIHNTDRIEAVAPGFINFYLSREYLFSQLGEVLEQKEKYGSKNEDPNKKVVVEYSSPNIAKPFTVGHLRSTIIGDAIANLLAANGWKVYRDNHLGDWGTQFGKQIYAIKTWGDEEKIEKSENPVKELVALYVKFHEEAEKNPELEKKAREWFKKLEDGNPEARRLWQKCVDWSWKEFENIYSELNVPSGRGIAFENGGRGYGESFFEDKIKPIIKELRGKKLLKESEDAELVFYPDDKFPPLMILKKDGTTLYSTRDLATDKFRLEEYGKDIVVVNEVGSEQTLYFKQLFEVEKMLGWYKEGQRIHVRHGLYRFKDEKMSTRKGNAIWLEDVLEEGGKRALNLSSKKNEKIVEKVAIGAIKWNDLKRASEQDIVFDWDEILNMQGDSGPYLQYAFARTQSVLAKSEIRNPKSETNLESRNPNIKKVSNFDHSNFDIVSNFDIRYSNLRLEDEEVSLLRTMVRFPEVVGQAGEKFAPNILCTYLFDLAQKFNLFYQKYKIIGSKEQDFRLALTAGVGQVIETGLNLLGIQSPEKM